MELDVCAFFALRLIEWSTNPHTRRMLPSERLAANMRALRSNYRWSQQELTDKVEGMRLSREAVNRIEANARGVDVDELHAIADAFGVPIRVLFA